MKIAFPTNGENLEAQIEQHFGRAKNYLVYDDETKEFKVYLNPETSGGSEPPPDFLNHLGVNVIITFGLGLRAQEKFKRMKIKICKAVEKNIISNIKDFKQNQLTELGAETSNDEFLLK